MIPETDLERYNRLQNLPGQKRKGFASFSKEKRTAAATKGGIKRKQMAEDGTAASYVEIGQKGGKVKRIKKSK